MEINQLITKSNALLKEDAFSTNRIYTYNWLWKRGILAYMLSQGITEYTVDVGNEFIITCNNVGNVDCTHRDMIKSVDVLNNVMITGSIGGRRHTPINYPLNGEIGDEARKFIEYLSDLRRNIKTIRDYTKRISIFIEFLSESGVTKPSEISEDIILAFVSTHTYGESKNIASIKLLLAFIYEHGAICNNFGYMLTSYSKKLRSEHERVPSFYTEDEVRKLEQTVSLADSVGKRDYAMLLLASRLGLRISDIANLRFDNLEWETNQIHLCQFKTGNPITLPLLPIVGNAIIDYLRFGRKQSSSDKVFLSCRAPYIPLTGSAVNNVIMRIFQVSGVDIKSRHHGGHALRFSLAQRMLEKSTPMPIISETLGHQGLDVTREYVRIDLPLLQQCALDIPSVNDNFYTQKGGCFYE